MTCVGYCGGVNVGRWRLLKSEKECVRRWYDLSEGGACKVSLEVSSDYNSVAWVSDCECSECYVCFRVLCDIVREVASY